MNCEEELKTEALIGLKASWDSYFKYFIYLFLERGREGKRGRETSMCGCLSRTHYWGPGPQPRCVL